MSIDVTENPHISALIVAGGKGLRAGSGARKQYRQLGGQPVLRRTVELFCAHKSISTVLVVIGAGDEALYKEAVEGLNNPKLLEPVIGGAERQLSVRAGLEALKVQSPDGVLIHDAARPLLSEALVTRMSEAISAPAPVAALAALPVIDTLKKVSDKGQIESTVERRHLWRAQTPQAFSFEAILKAHREFSSAHFTDDAAIAEAVGMPVQIIKGEERNIKLTREEDFAIAEAFLMTQSPSPKNKSLPHIGQGFDVHRLAKGDGLVLCGVSIPCDYQLLGHSDADVGLHALTDALLGAIGAGDIGHYFPPSEEKWKNVNSSLFLQSAFDKVKKQGGTLVNADVTLICEQPKIAPYREAMREKIAELLDVPLSRINVKATTSEELGFTGRKEGIAAQAVVSVNMPHQSGE